VDVRIAVLGQTILVDSLVLRSGGFRHGNRWQYHSRSDHHSKVACWGILFDLLRHCSLLRRHAAEGLIGYGLNHEFRDFRTGRKKKLDLVVCRPRNDPGRRSRARPRTFARDAEQIGVRLGDQARAELASLPEVRLLPVGSVLIALEAKACMTEFTKARPRLYDELNSSHAAIHGNSPHTIAAGLAMVNVATEFISPGRNEFELASRPPIITRHDQPRAAAGVVEKLREIPRRVRDGEEGFDAFAVIVVDCRNDGTPVRLVSAPPAPQPGDIYHYESMIHRLSQLYEQKFRDVGR
jgi:hypothetical protein